MSRHSVKVYLVAATVLLLGICPGCGTKRYEQRLEETVKRLGQESVFSGMYPPVELPGTGVTVRLPRFFGESPLPEGSDPRRLQLPQIEVPDLKLTYEGSIVDGAGGKQHFYCYLAATEKDPRRQLRRQVQTTFPAHVVDWEEVDCKKPDGGTSKWKKLRGAGPKQEFHYLDKDQNARFVPMPATTEIYVRQEGNLFLVIGWRMPTSIEKLIGVGGDLGLEQWAPRVAGSVRLKQ